MIKYPIYIVSKGRWENPLTAKMFKEDGVDFKMVVEPQEYDQYCEAIGEQYILQLPFSNLGLGSYPARNFCWEHSIETGHEKHWIFDDNIFRFRRYNNGKKIPANSEVSIRCFEDFLSRYVNVAIGGFNYTTFVVAGSSDKKPFYLNTHCYSAMLIQNDLPFRWRLKYNEDVDLCLQALHNNFCTISFNAFAIDKVSTASKMKGGNQTELYQNNAYEKKVQKARSLEEIWKKEGYVEVVMRYNRPHHYVDWKKHFQKNKLIKRTDFDASKLDKINNYGLKLKLTKEPKNKALVDFVQEHNSKD